jgi:hypothetical protein
MPGSFYDSRSRMRDVASKTGQRSRIRRAGHASRRGMASSYQTGTVEAANSLPELRGERYPIFHSLAALLQASIGADGTEGRPTTRDHENAVGRIRPDRCCLEVPTKEIFC